MTTFKKVLYQFIILVSLLAPALAARQTTTAAQPLPTPVDVFVSGQEGYHTYRIPSLLVTREGTLLAFAEGRKNGRSDSGHIDLVLKRSIDNGRTWSAQQVVASDPPNTIGNPCAVVDRDTGTIWLALTRNLGGDTEREIISGKSTGTRTVLITSSSDDGVSWSKPVDITATTKPTDWAWYATGPGVGIQLKSGRLLIPCDHQILGAASSRSHVIFSDDHGKSWKLGGVVGDKVNECQAVELGDGSVMINMRGFGRSEKCRAVSISKDGGESWSAITEDTSLIEPVCQASLVRFAGDGKRKPFVLFSNPASQQKREKLTLRMSHDEGRTWPTSRLIYEGSSAYSCLAILPDVSVGCLYEADNYGKIAFVRLRVDPADSWKQLPSLADSEGFAGSFAGISGGALLVAGGANFPQAKPWDGGKKVWYDSVFVLEKPDANWKLAGKLPRPLGYGVSVTWRGALICVGGSDADRHYADAFRLEWKDQQLVQSELRPLPAPLANACGALVGDTLYIAGGQDKPNATDTSKAIYRIDLAASNPAWQKIDPLPLGGRMLSVAAGFDGAFWVIGGVDLASGPDGKAIRRYLKDVLRFDPGKGWSQMPDLPHPIAAAPSPAPTDSWEFWLLGGDDGSQVEVAPQQHKGFSRRMLRYDARIKKFVDAGELPLALVTTPCVPWSGSWILPGGEIQPGIRSPQIWSFTPPTRK